MFKRTIAAFGFGLAACSTPAHAPSAAQPIAWHRFAPAAFEEARRENKLVMVDAGIEGCTACRWMHEGAYEDGGVIRRIHDGFVAVSVDADQEPDLGDRFLPWGWPATIFFTPDGRQVYALQGSESGADFAKLLDDLALQKKNGTLGTHTSESGRGEPNANLEATCIDTKHRLAEMSDAWGWGGTERVALFGAFEQGVIRARSRGESDIAAKADAYLGPQVRFETAWGTGALALAFEERLLGPVEITIVRGGDDALAKTMRDEMARVYEPRKIVRLEDAGHYPKPKTGAAIYVCTPVACSSPAATVEAARQNVERMTLAQNAACQ